MSLMAPHELQCPACGHTQTIEVWSTINVTVDPKLKDRLFNGEINTFLCEKCGKKSFIDTPLFYHDMRQNYCVQFYPLALLEDKTFFENFEADGSTKKISLPFMDKFADTAKYLANPHIVFAMDEMLRYITFREALYSLKEKPAIECIQGDITAQEGFDAIVNAANARLAPGGGVAGAVHRKAGPGLYEECKPMAPIKTGDALITKGYNLPNPYVIHTLGPIYSRENNPAEKLALCYRNCLKVAEEKNLSSIAFCAISTGAFGYPVEDAAEISVKAVAGELLKLKSVKKIRFVIYDKKTLDIFQEEIDSYFE
jgi:O-acetyl-ADP-ribose deacetylase